MQVVIDLWEATGGEVVDLCFSRVSLGFNGRPQGAAPTAPCQFLGVVKRTRFYLNRQH